jgi:penicillin amidase
LHEVLRDSGGFTVADFERLQHDDLSLLARQLAPVMAASAARAGAGERPEVRALATWDFHMARESMAPLIFSAWTTALGRQVYDAIYEPRIAATLRSRPDWDIVDSVLRTGRFDTVAVAALDSGVATIERRLGADRTAWTWGAVHVAELKHPVAKAFDLQAVARNGDANTVFATGGANLRQTSGASYREIIDLGNFDNSVAVNVPGQSGQPGSEHYDDLLALWGSGTYFPLVYSRARVEQETKHVLRLEP